MKRDSIDLIAGLTRSLKDLACAAAGQDITCRHHDDIAHLTLTAPLARPE